MGLSGYALLAASLAAVVAVACGDGKDSSSTEAAQVRTDATTPVAPAFSTPAPTPSPSPTPPQPSPEVDDSVLPDYMSSHWPNTDFSKHSVSYREIIAGAEPKVGIPAIDEPTFHPAAEAPEYMVDDEAVLAVEIGDDARAYPLAMLIFHEIVNDTAGGVPVVVTYCPLCNSAIVFHREVDGRLFDFGVSGNLRLSDLLMYDRQTESWWQQISGEAIVGELTGATLEFIPAPIVSWKEFKENYPDGQLLSRETGHDFPYGQFAYYGYDAPESWPQLLKKLPDLRLPSMERVVAVTIDGQDIAYPLSYIAKKSVFNDSMNGLDFVIFHAGDRLSPFPGGDGEDRRVIGSTGVFESSLNGMTLNFSLKDGRITDNETGSTWNILGKAVQGPLTGSRLTRVVHGDHFWFAWAAHRPNTLIKGEVDGWPPVFRSP